MWETPFEPSMLKKSDVIIHCPDRSDVNCLMEILASCGVKWCTGESLLTGDDCWGVEKENTVYYVENRMMSYGDKTIVNGHRGCARCTFWGVEFPDFEIASDSELRSFLGF